ncbi:glycosyltransferase [Rufibacter glacialis]|uniref:Glycosyltransferase n=1 Tax=Rufibacter glacialis TaxID=1259555 RepID=A0A5M8QB32_9BACT|nr:glycosyltransferase [Rufibacter glacialis]KAA6432368.1 glycosyltransferase [Rufibacter glacialis]GGK78126.1 glycosyl transferase [Rufibacter glacialis]
MYCSILKETQTSPIAEFEVCVLIPCYNNHEGLKASLESISYYPGRLCVVVVDDGSTTPVLKGIEGNQKDMITHVIRIEKNVGITAALNTGLQWIEDNLVVRYIARLDCADICHQDRFYDQVAFLDQNPEVGLLGTWCKFLDPQSGFSYLYTTPTQHEAILIEMHFRNVFIHPTVMFRAQLLKKTGFYPLNFHLVEDYALFFVMLHQTKGAVLDKVLVTCEINPKGLSISNRRTQLIGRDRVVNEFGIGTIYKWLAKAKLLILRGLPYQFVLFVKNKRN